MPSPVSALDNFPAEAALVGQILSSYTGLELELLHAVQVVRDDFDTCLKVLFRTRGETQRLDVVDALGRHYYAGYSLETEFAMAVGAARQCMKVRNQYAHCIWWDDNTGQLAFANLEDAAVLKAYVSDLRDLPSYHVDVPLLERQMDHYRYAMNLIRWVNYEGRKSAGTLPGHRIAKS